MAGGRQTLGERAEHVAAQHLQDAGYRVLGRNVRFRLGEIDIVAEDRRSGAVAIVEVKAMASDTPSPEQHVNFAKQQKLTALAGELIRQWRLADRTVRFDVVAIVWPDGSRKPTRLTHHANAFEAAW